MQLFVSEYIPDILSKDHSKEVGIAIISAWYYAFNALNKRYTFLRTVPSVLTSTIAAWISLNMLKLCSKQRQINVDTDVATSSLADDVSNFFDPAVTFLGDWMSLWLVAPCVLLPRAIQNVQIRRGGRGVWVRALLVHLGLWLGTTCLTATVFDKIDKKYCNQPIHSLSEGTCSEKVSASELALTEEPSAPEQPQDTMDKKVRLIRFWGVITASFYAAAAGGVMNTGPALASTSITALSVGISMDASIKKVIHPLIFTAIITIFATICTERIRDSVHLRGGKHRIPERTWIETLSAFASHSSESPTVRAWSHPGGGVSPGSVFSSLLGPSCTALAFRMIKEQQNVREKLPAVAGAAACSAIASIFLSPLAGKVFGLPAEINGALAHRSVTSPLAISSAEVTGISPELTVAAVIITGLYASTSEWLLEKLSIGQQHNNNIVSAARGCTLGTSSHAIGTSTLLSQGDSQAAGVASVSMVVAASAHAIACSVPGVKGLIRSLAGLPRSRL